MRDIECQQPGDPVTLHGRHEPDIVCPEARHAMGLDERKLQIAELVVVG